MRGRHNWLTLLVLSAIFSAVEVTFAQSVAPNRNITDLANRQLKTVALEGQLPSLLTRLSLNYDIPIGFEMSPEDSVSTRYRVKLEDGTLANLMDQIVSQNNQYDWIIENDVVNVFPRQERKDSFLGEVLSVRIGSFTVRQNSDCWEVQKLLFDSPEIKSVIDTYGMRPIGINFSGFYIPKLGESFSLNASNLTLKELLNRIVKESPLARIWLISTDSSSRTVSLTLSSRQTEDARR